MSFTNSFLLKRYGEVSGASPEKGGQSSRQDLGEVVVAEANPSDLEHLATILSNLRFNVLTAQDGKAALALIRKHRPLLVLASLQLPQISGYMLVQKLREDKATESIPCMFIVEGGETPDQLIGHETYANDYIQKPISVPEFESRVIGLLNLARQRRDRQPEDESTAPPETPVPEAAQQDLRTLSAWGDLQEQSATIAESIERMRLLMAEFTNCLAEVERRLRLSAALTDTPAPGLETGPRGDALPSESGALLTFQTQRQKLSRNPEAPAQEIEPGAAAVGGSAFPEVDERALALEALEKFRSEFRRLGSGEVGGIPGKAAPAEEDWEPAPAKPERSVQPAAHSGRSANAELPAWALDKGEEKGTVEPETGLEFDSELLTRLGVDLAVPVGEQIKAEEFTSFARQSFLSAFLEESEKVGRFESLYEEAQDFVLRSIRRAAVGGVPYAARAEALVDRLIDLAGQSDRLLLQATDRERSFTVSSHSVNVAVLAIRVAQVRQLSRQFQQRVGLAALFHEIGVVKLPEKLVFKESPLTDGELKVLRNRPLFSARVLQEEFGVVREVVGQVFERENGLGYPFGLKGGQIRPEAKIIGVVDFFEACIHPRPYREPITGYQALYELSRDGEFDQAVVRALVRTVSLFPLNEILLLSSGEVVRVVGINPGGLSRPVVRVELRSDGTEEREERLIDLAKPGGARIVEVLTHEKLASLRRRS